MTTEDTKRSRLSWLALIIFGCGLCLMLAVSALLFRSTSFADRLAQVFGHPLSENQHLAVSLGVGLAVELIVLVPAYLLFPRRRAGI